eukprot:scaffold166019_cov19-Tisochrysis_lutea.AAC.3
MLVACALMAVPSADTHGNVACFSKSGEELWMRHVRSLVAQNPTAGDINSDGEIEGLIGHMHEASTQATCQLAVTHVHAMRMQVLFGTSSGHVYALSGTSGLDIKNFPFRTHGRCGVAEGQSLVGSDMWLRQAMPTP